MLRAIIQAHTYNINDPSGEQPTPNLYSEGATLSNFIHEGRPTTTKLTLVDLPSSIDHSTFRECSKGILYLPPTFHHSPLTRLVGYAQSYKLILTTSTTHPVNNETPNLYSEGATLSNFIHEGRPTTTKLTLVDLPSSINHSTFRECSKGILYLPPTFHHSPLTRPVVIILYSLCQ